jgi:hypothetical protein
MATNMYEGSWKPHGSLLYQAAIGYRIKICLDSHGFVARLNPFYIYRCPGASIIVPSM